MKARNDPLGPGGLKLLKDNLAWLRRQSTVEHIAGTGEHNAWQVPRRLVNISGTSVSPATSDISSVTNPAVGRYVINLAANRFTTDIRPQINIAQVEDVSVKPCVAGYVINSATQFEVFIKKLSSALGAGNAWAAEDAQFDIAIHSDPLNPGTFTADQLEHARGDTLEESTTDWNATVEAHAAMYSMLTAAHTTAGAHNVLEVAKYYAHVNYRPPGGAASYETQSASSGVAVNRTGTGVCEVTYTALTSPSMAFVSPDYQRIYSGGTAADLFVMNAVRNSTTKHTVYIYQYSGGNWSAADADFFIAIHGS